MKCEKCNCNALKGDTRCFWHSEDLEVIQKRQEARRRGGKTKAQRKRKVARTVPSSNDAIKTAADVRRVLSQALDELRAIKAKDRIAVIRATGYISNVLLKAIEVSDLEARITALEQEDVT